MDIMPELQYTPDPSSMQRGIESAVPWILVIMAIRKFNDRGQNGNVESNLNFQFGHWPEKGCAYAKDRRSNLTSGDSEEEIKPSGKACGKDRFVFPATPRDARGRLKRSIEEQFHTMVFATRKEIRRYCPRYRSLPGEGILDFNTDCASANWSRVMLAPPHHPSGAGCARRAASSPAFPRSKSLT